MARPLEWIGVRSPIQSDAVMFRILTGVYSESDEYWLKVMASALARVIRVDGSRARQVGPKDGLSKHYRFGARPKASYIQMVEDIDADRIMSNPHLEYEFRDLHVDHEREPVIPEVWMNRAIWECLKAAENGPGVSLSGEVPAIINRPVSSILGTDSGQLRLPSRHDNVFVT